MSPGSPDTRAPLDWTGFETRYLFFTGKGGVGIDAGTDPPARPGVRSHADRHAPRIINASLAADHSTHHTLRARGDAEHIHIRQVLQASSNHTWLVGWHPQPPERIDALRELTTGATAGAH